MLIFGDGQNSTAQDFKIFCSNSDESIRRKSENTYLIVMVLLTMENREFIINFSRTWFFDALEEENKEIELSFFIKIFDILRRNSNGQHIFRTSKNCVLYECLWPSSKVKGLGSSDVTLTKFHTESTFFSRSSVCNTFRNNMANLQ